LRDSEISFKQKESDSIRLTSELDKANKQLEQKDVDLRLQMASYTEERLGSRADMNGLQQRIQLLEQERLETTSQLAAKREECLSSSRQLLDQKESLSTLESKHTEAISSLESKVTLLPSFPSFLYLSPACILTLIQSLHPQLSLREAEMKPGQVAILELEIQSKLLSISEVRENAERMERIACSAQLLAVQYQCTNQIKEIEEKMELERESLRREIGERERQRDEAKEATMAQSDVSTRLESEVAFLSLSLSLYFLCIY
jgi:hypothetical protein